MEINQNRVPSIRFHEPNDRNESDRSDTVLHHPPKPNDIDGRKLISSLKSSTDSSMEIFQKSRTKNLVNSNAASRRRNNFQHRQSRKNNDLECYQPNQHHHHQQNYQYSSERDRKIANDSIETGGRLIKETAKSRREKLARNPLNHSQSFSLESIFFEGLLSEGLSDRNERRRKWKARRRILSFEDLPAIKKELSESSQEDYGVDLMESEQYKQYEIRLNSLEKSPKELNHLDHRNLHHHHHHHHHHQHHHPHQQHHHHNHHHHRHHQNDHHYRYCGKNNQNDLVPNDNRISSSDEYFARLSRDDILNLWSTSERELLDQLLIVQQQKRLLEDKVANLQRMLAKSP
ncbi:hypothetical protein QR98_0098000 [Sarcoptes scabiei]|uniref:Uncharacterized protein n=1 Tax=Sarcoptes scabiei TaxID=52283 RepID=A0A132ALB0_SARSC|nr:hypothetical protein QR98_0098000 [Sarcoptes scabiei]